ncbi:hypothetical protein L218DRAFT_174228 [Marasmius fiardii PR-910]|nr:hypothetical protein L218DRAFT_174228 [Marasmius fiardii PR-910]
MLLHDHHLPLSPYHDLLFHCLPWQSRGSRCSSSSSCGQRINAHSTYGCTCYCRWLLGALLMHFYGLSPRRAVPSGRRLPCFLVNFDSGLIFTRVCSSFLRRDGGCFDWFFDSSRRCFQFRTRGSFTLTMLYTQQSPLFRTFKFQSDTRTTSQTSSSVSRLYA